MDQNNMTVVAHHRVLLCLQPTAETQYFQLSLPVVVVVADRGNLAHHHQWIMEELAAAPEHQVVVDQTQVTVLIVVSAITAGVALMVKDILEVPVLDLMQTLKILTKVAAEVEQAVQVQVLRMDVNDIVRLLEVIKLQAAPAVQQIF
jgi:hypothetical protein